MSNSTSFHLNFLIIETDLGLNSQSLELDYSQSNIRVHPQERRPISKARVERVRGDHRSWCGGVILG